jgi:AcrR family transcriptional regulator
LPRPRFKRLDAEKKHAILEAAAEEFADKGFEGASTNRIIENAGMSKGAFYYYFDDKADLYATTLGNITDDLLSRIEAHPETVESDGFWAIMERLALVGQEVIAEKPNMVKLFQGWYQLPPSARENPAINHVDGIRDPRPGAGRNPHRPAQFIGVGTLLRHGRGLRPVGHRPLG